jgi:hypothetical protein
MKSGSWYNNHSIRAYTRFQPLDVLQHGSLPSEVADILHLPTELSPSVHQQNAGYIQRYFFVLQVTTGLPCRTYRALFHLSVSAIEVTATLWTVLIAAEMGDFRCSKVGRFHMQKIR